MRGRRAWQRGGGQGRPIDDRSCELLLNGVLLSMVLGTSIETDTMSSSAPISARFDTVHATRCYLTRFLQFPPQQKSAISLGGKWRKRPASVVLFVTMTKSRDNVDSTGKQQ